MGASGGKLGARGDSFFFPKCVLFHKSASPNLVIQEVNSGIDRNSYCTSGLIKHVGIDQYSIRPPNDQGSLFPLVGHIIFSAVWLKIGDPPKWPRLVPFEVNPFFETPKRSFRSFNWVGSGVACFL